MSALAEYYDPENSPHDALGRAARRLVKDQAIYAGGGVGVEYTRDDRYVVTHNGAVRHTSPGPLSAVARAFAAAGATTAHDSPGGSTAIADPSIAARVRELDSRERDLDARLKELRAQPAPMLAPGATDYRTRALERDTRELATVRRERSRLLRGGAVAEAEVGKPGTNWTQVSPEHRARLHGLIEFYRKKAHPFTACVRDNRKRFGPNAERVCAVVKDLIEKRTTWRRGGNHKVTEAIGELLAEAQGRLDALEESLGAGAPFLLVEGDFDEGADVELMEQLAELAFADMTLLHLAGCGPSPALDEAFGASAPAADARKRVKAMGLTPRAKTAGSSSGFNEGKHRRAPRGAARGGQFVQMGASGWGAHAVQRRLGVREDGAFGAKTRQAVMEFQRRHGLTVDGIVGHQTALALAGRMRKARAAKVGSLTAEDRDRLRGLRRAARPSARDRATRVGGGQRV